MSISALVNANAVETLDGQVFPDRSPLRFHRRLPGYEETPLVGAPGLADAMGVGNVLVKDESGRLGLPAFKILGASWATYRALQERLPEGAFGDWETVEDLRETGAPAAPRPRDGHRWQPRPRVGPRGPATGARGEDLRARGHGGRQARSHSRRGGRGGRGRRHLRRGRRALGRRGGGERARGLGYVLAWLRADTLLGDRRLLDHALGDRRRARKEGRSGARVGRGADRR